MPYMYFPVARADQVIRPVHLPDGTMLGWWSRKCPIFYPAMLISYGMVHDMDRRDFTRCEIDPEVQIMADSGGFEQALGRQFDPVDVAKWQIEQTPARYVIILDHPLYKRLHVSDHAARRTVPVTSIDEVRRLAEKTADNIRKMVPIYERRDVEWYLVQQGEYTSPEIWKTWYDIAVRPFLRDAAGVAFASFFLPRTLSDRSLREVQIPLIFKVMTEVPELFDKNVHIFAMSTLTSHACLIYLSDMVCRRLVSTDSIRSRISMIQRRAYYIFWNVTVELKTVEGLVKHCTDLKKQEMPCMCPACRLYEKFYGSALNRNYLQMREEKLFLIVLHNLYMELDAIKKLRLVSPDPKLMQKMLKRLLVGMRRERKRRKLLVFKCLIQMVEDYRQEGKCDIPYELQQIIYGKAARTMTVSQRRVTRLFE